MEDLEENIPADIIGFVKHEMPCIAKGCDGKLSYFLKQADDGSVAICNKCQKSIMIRSIKV